MFKRSSVRAPAPLAFVADPAPPTLGVAEPVRIPPLFGVIRGVAPGVRPEYDPRSAASKDGVTPPGVRITPPGRDGVAPARDGVLFARESVSLRSNSSRLSLSLIHI